MKQITIGDIAREAGVSKATVSRVLSKPNLVREKTLKKVSSIIEKHSYVPNILAQGLAGMPTKNIGVMVEEFTNIFYIDLADGIESVVSENNYTFQLMSSKWKVERELEGIRFMLKGRVDGVLMAPASSDSPAVLELRRSETPFVLVNCLPADSSVSFVSCDYYRGGALLAEYFNTLDYEQVIIVSVVDHETIRERIRGFEDNLNPGVKRLIRYGNIKTFNDGYEFAGMITETSAIRKKKTAFFVTNDSVAISFVMRFLEMGIAVPGQVAVAGFDDLRFSSFCRIPLTTVSQSVVEAGKTAAENLMKLIKNRAEAPLCSVINPRLIIRNSA
jgi:DNA-binding LacI/PurR family transcriptional regulator